MAVKKFSYILLVTYCLLFTGTVFAADFMFGVQGGYGKLDLSNKTDTAIAGANTYTMSPRRQYGFSFRMFSAYLWQANKWRIGPELGYSQSPEITYRLLIQTTGQADQTFNVAYHDHDFDLLFRAQYNLSPHFLVITKVGAAQVNQIFNFAKGVAVVRKVGVFPEADLGFGYEFDNNWNINLNYRHIFAKHVQPGNLVNDPNVNSTDNYTNIASVNEILFGIGYRFNGFTVA